MMFSLDGFVEIFGVSTESQTPILFPSVDLTVNPGFGFTFIKFCDDAVFDNTN